MSELYFWVHQHWWVSGCLLAALLLYSTRRSAVETAVETEKFEQALELAQAEGKALAKELARATARAERSKTRPSYVGNSESSKTLQA